MSDLSYFIWGLTFCKYPNKAIYLRSTPQIKVGGVATFGDLYLTLRSWRDESLLGVLILDFYSSKGALRGGVALALGIGEREATFFEVNRPSLSQRKSLRGIWRICVIFGHFLFKNRKCFLAKASYWIDINFLFN